MSDMNPSPEFEEQVRRAVQAPDADPAFVNRLRNELTRRPAKVQPRALQFRPAWALALALLLIALLISTPAAVNALKRLLGYVPGTGLVENTGQLRILKEPVSLTREGVTLRIESVIVYADHVEIIYTASGIPAENDSNRASDGSTHPKAFCGGVEIGDTYNPEGDPRLRLPDGTLLERDLTGKYPQNVFATKPVYEAVVPPDVTELTFVLPCIPWARHGAVPENWELSIPLTAVPADTILGSPVIELEQTAVVQTAEPVTVPVTAQPAPALGNVTVTLEKVVPLEASTVFYLSLDMENKDPSLISLMPKNVYALDAQGQKVWLIANYTWQPFEHRVGSAFEFSTQTKPDGPLTLVVENAVAVYAPLYSDPPQTQPEQMTFTFEVGDNPQYNQIWPLNAEISIAGYALKVTSVRAAHYADLSLTNDPLGSQGFEYGYDFTLETDTDARLQVLMDILSESPVCGLSSAIPDEPLPTPLHVMQFCRDAYPQGTVKVVIWQLSVLVEKTWQLEWKP